jgi:hypothetical protein
MRDFMTPTPTIRVGLRFRRSSARTLQNIANRIRAGELPHQAVSTFELAADAARTGEPLIVECKDPMEAHLMAAGYVRFGIAMPAIETLTS